MKGMTRKSAVAISILTSSLVFSVAVPVFAQGITLTNPLGNDCTDLTCPLTAILNFLYTISISLCAIMVLVGGFQMITSAGDPEKFSKGRKTIIYAAIGFVVILLAGSVASLIRNILGNSS